MTHLKTKYIEFVLWSIAIADLFIICSALVILIKPQEPFQQHIFGIISFAAGVLIAISIVILIPRIKATQKAETDEASIAVVPPPRVGQNVEISNDQAVLLLSLLQEKGRLLDFLMEDVAAYPNEQIGAAARFIHQGCREVVIDCFNPKPLTEEMENTEIILEHGFKVSDYKLVGNVKGKPPYKGKLIHKGWKAQQVKLPRLNHPFEDPNSPVILPAEVEL